MSTLAAKKFEEESTAWAEQLDLRPNQTFETAISDLLFKLRWTSPKSVELPSGTTTLEVVEGGEGKGENYMVRFKCGDKYFECHGYYDSWEGTSWEGVEAIEVKPVEVLVTQYKPVTD